MSTIYLAFLIQYGNVTDKQTQTGGIAMSIFRVVVLNERRRAIKTLEM